MNWHLVAFGYVRKHFWSWVVIYALLAGDAGGRYAGMCLMSILLMVR